MSTPEHDRDEDAVEPARDDVDAAWADIVSRWEGPLPRADDPGAPDADHADDAQGREAPGDQDADPALLARPAAALVGPAPAGPRDHVLAEPDDDAFVPEVAPPLSRMGWTTWLPWAGVLGGPVLLVVAALVYGSVPGGLLALAVAAFMAGVALLVLRLPTRRTDDGDDGAVL